MRCWGNTGGGFGGKAGRGCARKRNAWVRIIKPAGERGEGGLHYGQFRSTGGAGRRRSNWQRGTGDYRCFWEWRRPAGDNTLVGGEKVLAMAEKSPAAASFSRKPAVATGLAGIRVDNPAWRLRRSRFPPAAGLPGRSPSAVIEEGLSTEKVVTSARWSLSVKMSPLVTG